MYRFETGDKIRIESNGFLGTEIEGYIHALEEQSGFDGYRLESGTWIYAEWAKSIKKPLLDQYNSETGSTMESKTDHNGNYNVCYVEWLENKIEGAK